MTATLALAVMVVTAAALVVVRPGAVRALLGGPEPSPSATTSPPPPRPVLDPVGDAPPPARDRLAAAIAALAGDSRVGDLSASVVDVASGEPLYERASRRPVVPASVNKLVTAAAVLATYDPAHRLATRAVAGGESGEVVLVGDGDPTLAVDGGDTYRGAARLDDLAAQVKRNLGAAPTRVVVDSSVFSGPPLGPGWDPDIAAYGYAGPVTGLMVNGGRLHPKRPAPRATRPDLAAGEAFAKLLGLPASAVTAGQAPGDARELGVVESPPLLRLVEIMLADSDNVVAEALARLVARAKGAEASYRGAAEATLRVLEEMGLPTDGVRLADGSGLSRQNRLTASLVTALLARAASDGHARLSGMFGGLPVAGWSGTLHDRFGGAGPGAGLVRAKTGTLNGVSALAGVVLDRDGRLLAFALIANGVPGGPAGAEAVLDRIAARLAACGC